MHTKTLSIVATLLAGALAGANGTSRVERRIHAMGTELSIVIDAPDRAAGLAAGERVAEAMQAAETRLSTWNPASELSRLNAAGAGTPVPISRLLARDLAAAQRCSVETDGAFTPGMGALVAAWGLRTGGLRPPDEAIARVLSAVQATNLHVSVDRATRLDARFIVEEGAFGKGVGLDDAIDALAGTAADGAVLDLGGQVAVWGGGSVAIEIADPRHRDRAVLRLEVSHGSVATTGNSQRGIVVDGKRLGHVIDPATGHPSRDFGSVTVWAERAALADCLSTGLYVMGPDRALEWVAGRPDVAVVVLEVDERGLRARASSNLRGRLRAATDDLDLRFSDTGTETP